ncbi:MAG: leucine-rich repeat domain-containing protein [Muribaculaceae bacterium]
MKQNIFKRLALVAVLLFGAITASAYDFEVNGIFYNKNVDGTTVSVTYEGDWASYSENEYSGSVTIPASVTYSGKTYSVTSIGEEAFRDCSGLTAVKIPNSVTTIDSYVFYGCGGLREVEIPNSVTTIGSYAFYGNYGLKEVEIPNSVTTIGSYAFEGCSGLTAVEIPNSVTSIGYNAFYECKNLKTVF